MVPEQGSHLARPTVRNAKVALARALQRLSSIVHDDRLDSEERSCGRTWLQRRRARQRRNENPASLSLPPCVNDRHATVADHSVIPKPCFRIDWLADATQEL